MTVARPIGTLGLVFILFFTTSGGAFTTEGLVLAVLPMLVLLLVVVLSVVDGEYGVSAVVGAVAVVGPLAFRLARPRAAAGR